MADIPEANGRSVISSAESLYQLEERDLDALVADLGAESIKNSNADQPGAAPAEECEPAASLRPSNTAGVSTKVPKVSTQRKNTLAFRYSANDPVFCFQSDEQLKAEKISLALQKLKEAKVRKVVSLSSPHSPRCCSCLGS